MFCPHCHNKIPDGSNICPLCYSNLAGVKAQQKSDAPHLDAATGEVQTARKSAPATRSKKTAYTKGSRGSKKKSADNTPMIIAFGLIIILIIIIVMIVRSMFGVGDPGVIGQTATKQPAMSATATPAQNFIVFGATSAPKKAEATPTPRIEVTATPAPQEPASVTYKTLRKNDQGEEVVMLQKALSALGYLSGAQDGIFGTGTQTAVKNFQKDNDLDADGIAGSQTLKTLYSKVQITPMPDVTVGPGDILDLPG